MRRLRHPGAETGLADWFGTALWGLAMLRTGQICRDEGARTTEVHAAEMDTVVRDLDVKLLPRLAGIRDAAIRRHRELGGSVGALAVPRSTAQTRREGCRRVRCPVRRPHGRGLLGYRGVGRVRLP
ncbi:hypothetical protein UK15_38675 [Streptomyces variegatus]|uniref:Uncharacterized protein n=1 Tax=Streptomyces variegatus TaxID=284040 RepID=A0A0M2GBW9_9ACTN|nr:hypothetical protein UK15_38675 [Streptomyces variegatus]